MSESQAEPEQVEFSSPAGRWILAATVAGSGIAMLTGTVVSVALPAIGEQFDAGTAGQQWVVNGYMVTLASLILLGGSLGDRLGRRRVFVAGVIVFALSSVASAVAVNLPMLIASRVVMGVGGALLTPGSLAIIQASFVRRDRPRAIGAWSALGGIAIAVGPFVGGWLVDIGSWRAVFLLNIPLAVAVIYAAVRHVPESRDAEAAGRLDWVGASLATVGLAGVTYAVIAAPQSAAALPWLAGAVGAAALVAFLAAEARMRHPMMPLDIFGSRQFTAANGVTFVVYAALGTLFFLLVVYLQVVLEYSALAAGSAAMPVTLIMFFLSERGGELAQRIGPRRPLTFGPMLMGAGFVGLSFIAPGTSYVTGILPPIVVLALGLALTVAPVTSTVMAAADERHSGVASGVNNAVARTAQLLAVAVIPVAAGLGADGLSQPEQFQAGFPRAMFICAGLAAAGGVLAWFTIDDTVLADEDEQVEPRPVARHDRHCAVDGPPLRTEPDHASA
jgi:EmrB/QacA subfamily drug resistance transporter